MVNDERLSKQYQFTPRVDIPTSLATLEIEYLDVSDERTIVIYNHAIFNIEVDDGQLDDARTICIDLFDPPPDADGTDSAALIERLIDRIGTVADATWQEVNKQH